MPTERLALEAGAAGSLRAPVVLFRAQGLGLRAKGLGFRGWMFRVEDFRVLGL